MKKIMIASICMLTLAVAAFASDSATVSGTAISEKGKCAIETPEGKVAIDCDKVKDLVGMKVKAVGQITEKDGQKTILADSCGAE